MREALWDWEIVARRMSPGFPPPALYDGRYLVVGGGRSGTDVVARDTRSGRRITTIRPERGYHFDYRFLSAPWLVWTEVHDLNPRTVVAYRLDLRTGERLNLNDAPGVAEPGVPQVWFVAHGRAAYTTQRGRKNCIVILSLDKLSTRIATCVSRPKGIGFPRLGGGAVTVTRWQPRPKPDGCRKVFTVPLREPAAIRGVPARERCAPYAGVAGPGFLAWDEHDRYHDPDESNLFHAVDHARPIHLDVALTATARVCAGWLYWNAHIPGDKGTEIRRWRPRHDIEIIYRSHPDYATMSPPYCHGDLITFTRAWTGGGIDRQQLVAGSVGS